MTKTEVYDDNGRLITNSKPSMGTILRDAWKPLPQDGMTLRDSFAKHALEGMLAHSRNGHGYRPKDPSLDWHTAIAEEAYEIADSMMKARGE